MIIDENLINGGIGHALMVQNMDKFKNPYESSKSVMLGANVLQLKKTRQDIKEDDQWLNDLVEPIIPGKDKGNVTRIKVSNFELPKS